MAQTYQQRELIVLSQGDPGQNVDIVARLDKLGRQDIKFFEAPPDLSLGQMRNASVELASGEIVCQWDDDDLYHPERLAAQYRALRSDSRNLASLYTCFLKYFVDTGELYWCDWSGEPLVSHRFLCGTIMFPKGVFHRFPSFYPNHGPQSGVEEDLNVLEKLLGNGRVAGLNAGEHYIYTFHGDNTYDRGHHLLAINTAWGKRLLGVEELLRRRDVIEDALRIAGVHRRIKARSAEGVAFTYEGV